MNRTLAQFLQEAMRNGAESTVCELFDILDIQSEEGTLAKLFLVRDNLAKLGLRLIPGIEQGELESVRRVEIAEPLPTTEAEVLADLHRREAEDLELKSSLLYDHARAKHEPDASIADLKSQSVLSSALRTIAAFLTGSGGLLYVGADDAGRVLGIEYDFPCIAGCKEEQNADRWELFLRSTIQDRFKEGRNINDYVSCEVFTIDGRLIGRLQVAARAKLAFLKQNGSYCLYRRQGNRTVDVSIDLVEEFIDFRRGLRA